MNLKAQEFLTSLDEATLGKLYRDVFQGWNGQLVLQDLRNRGFYYTSTYDKESDPISRSTDVIFHEGMRALLLHIDTMMRAMPDQPTVHKEGSDGQSTVSSQPS